MHIEVKPEKIDDFTKAITIDASGSRYKEGCYRFDVLRDIDNPYKFTFYEVYKSEQAF